jgi:hypothetical protein
MKIMRKGIAVDTIVLIILAIIVLGLVGYLIYTTFTKGKCKIDSTECLAARLDCCCAAGTLAEVEKACGSCEPDQIKDCTGLPCPGPCQ